MPGVAFLAKTGRNNNFAGILKAPDNAHVGPGSYEAPTAFRPPTVAPDAVSYAAFGSSAARSFKSLEGGGATGMTVGPGTYEASADEILDAQHFESNNRNNGSGNNRGFEASVGTPGPFPQQRRASAVSRGSPGLKSRQGQSGGQSRVGTAQGMQVSPGGSRRGGGGEGGEGPDAAAMAAGHEARHPPGPGPGSYDVSASGNAWGSGAKSVAFKDPSAKGAEAMHARLVGAAKEGAVAWLRVPCAPSIPGKAQTLGYEEGPRGELVMIAGRKGYSGMFGDGPGPSDYRAELVQMGTRTLDFGKGGPRPDIPGTRKRDDGQDKVRLVRKNKEEKAHKELVAAGGKGKGPTPKEVAAALAARCGLPPVPVPGVGEDVSLAVGGGGFANGGGTLRLAPSSPGGGGGLGQAREWQRPAIEALDPHNPFGQKQQVYERFGASPVKPSPAFMPPTFAGHAVEKETRPGPGSYNTASSTLAVGPSPPEALQFFGSTSNRFQTGNAMGGGSRVVAAPLPGPGAYEQGPSSFARAMTAGRQSQARAQRLAFKSGGEAAGPYSGLGFDSSEGPDRSKALTEGRGSTFDVGPGEYEARGFAEVALQRARGGNVVGLDGLQVSNGDFLSSSPRFPERSWEAASKRRPGPASYFPTTREESSDASQRAPGAAGGLPVGGLVSISAAVAAQRPLPHAANAVGLGWRPATVPGSSASYQPGDVAVLPGGVAPGKSALPSERSLASAALGSVAGDGNSTVVSFKPNGAGSKGGSAAVVQGGRSAQGGGRGDTAASATQRTAAAKERPGSPGLEAAMGAAARAAALMAQRDMGLLHGSIPMGSRGTIGHGGPSLAPGKAGTGGFGPAVSVKGPAGSGMLRGSVRKVVEVASTSFGSGGGPDGAAMFAATTPYGYAGISAPAPLGFGSTYSASFKSSGRDRGGPVGSDRDPADLRRARASAGGGQQGHGVDLEDKEKTQHSEAAFAPQADYFDTGGGAGTGQPSRAFVKPLSATDVAPSVTSSAVLAKQFPDTYSLQQGCAPVVKGPTVGGPAAVRWQEPPPRKADEANRVGPGSYSAPSLLGAQGGSLGLVRRSARGVMDSTTGRSGGADDPFSGGPKGQLRPGPGAYDPIKTEGNLLAKTYNVAILAQSALTV